MRLLMISHDFPPAVGGTQTYAYELARRLADRCADFAVVAPRVPGAEAVDATLPFEVLRVRASYNTFPARLVGPLMATRKRLPVTLHVQWHTAASSLLARPFGGARRVFVAAHGRELLFQPLARRLPNTLYHRIRTGVLQRADAVFPVSQYTAALLADMGVSDERISIIHNGTDPAQFRPLDATPLRQALGLNGEKTLLTVGRLVPRKGIDTVLRALPEVARQIPDVRYLVGGGGPDRDRLEALARTLNVSDRVRFLGRISHETLPSHYNACDVFVMPSREDMPHVEGFGIVFLEASACGKPVVGARAGGIPDAVRHGETGLLVEPDDEAGLAATLIRLLQDDNLAARLGRNGRDHVLAQATWDHMAHHLYEAIEERLCTSS